MELSRQLRAYSLELSDRSQTVDLGKVMARLFGDEMSTPIGTRRDDRFPAVVVSAPAGEAEAAQPTRETSPRRVRKRGWRRWWAPTVLAGVFLGVAGALLIDWEGAMERPAAADAGPVDAGSPLVVAAPEPDGGPAPDAEPAGADLARKPARKRPGTLVLSSDPWAYVEINGKRLREPTPIPGLRLRAGTYRIRLFNPDAGLSKTIRVRILPGKITRRVVRF
jgi:hypothetical protein